MIKGNKSGAGGPTASPKTRRALSGSDSSSIIIDRVIRRAPPSGDSKTGTAATDADACAKLQAMAKKAQGSGPTSPNAPKPKPGSTTTTSAPPNASPKAAPSCSYTYPPSEFRLTRFFHIYASTTVRIGQPSNGDRNIRADNRSHVSTFRTLKV
ncbi:uncharacterized protein MELLADRAFT_59198 [Melampsora larici-populina 98AG31]|uniref:Uncharacterized protein n=1 Tax=Melampsora larici-populina (strain 98AG31 / pathotype 3-4-7) TaxID=747676 RepID=F4R5E3_MELLP|nr:uncharacterized protein MELLADRAFT_59198 [Melampsora larici-populina 98AG31]EGG12274.1 hypothetical protein MELLADRAFT_59198 [Melampsora larici-populina 98AG31]